jgi:hypothetical protein
MGQDEIAHPQQYQQQAQEAPLLCKYCIDDEQCILTKQKLQMQSVHLAIYAGPI